MVIESNWGSKLCTCFFFCVCLPLCQFILLYAIRQHLKGFFSVYHQLIINYIFLHERWWCYMWYKHHSPWKPVLARFRVSVSFAIENKRLLSYSLAQNKSTKAAYSALSRGINIENWWCEMAFNYSQQLLQKTPHSELGIRLSKITREKQSWKLQFQKWLKKEWNTFDRASPRSRAWLGLQIEWSGSTRTGNTRVTIELALRLQGANYLRNSRMARFNSMI